MTREDALAYEESLHRRYFDPFDRLLEKKAHYYLQKADAGNEIKPLLNEIEVLERFREYAVILETLLQEAIDGQHLLANKILHLKEWGDTNQWLLGRALFCAEHYQKSLQRLQEQCQHQP